MQLFLEKIDLRHFTFRFNLSLAKFLRDLKIKLLENEIKIKKQHKKLNVGRKRLKHDNNQSSFINKTNRRRRQWRERILSTHENIILTREKERKKKRQTIEQMFADNVCDSKRIYKKKNQ